jgi:hypothetical protein
LSEPRVLQAGDSWGWTRSEPDYPASAGWVLTYFFAMAAEEPRPVVAVASGDAFLLEVAAEDATWPAGTYRWTARVAKAGDVHTVGSGSLQVRPDPTAAHDRRSYEEKIVAILEPALVKCAGNLIVEYEMDGVKVKRDRASAIKELNDCREILRNRRRRERGESLFTRFPVVFP